MISFDFRSHIQVTLMQDVGSHGLVQLCPCNFAGYSSPPGCLHKLLVDLPFWGLEDSGPLLTAPLGGAPVWTLWWASDPTFSFCTSLAEDLHEGPAQQTFVWTSRGFHVSSEISAEVPKP